MSLLPDRFRAFKALGTAAEYESRILAALSQGQVKLLEAFTAEDMRRLCPFMSVFGVNGGQEVIVEGEVGEFMLLMIDGTMTILKNAPDGLPVQISEVSGGQTLGEMSVIDGGPRFASCVAKTDVLFAVLDREQLRQLIEQDAAVASKLLMQLLQLLNQRLRNVSERLMEVLKATQDDKATSENKTK